MTRDLILIAHNLRSCHNVGSLFRTADGLGISNIYLSGYTPYPVAKRDERLPHDAAKAERQINKTALGAIHTMSWKHFSDVSTIISRLKERQYLVVGLEQTDSSVDITTWMAPSKVALIVGRETEGIEPEVLQMCDVIAEIPMYGKKESFNVVQAGAMALYHLRFVSSSLQ